MLCNLFEFENRMGIYRDTPAGDLSYWLRVTGVTTGAVVFLVGYLIAGMRALRRVRGAATLIYRLAIASLIWTIMKSAFKMAGVSAWTMWTGTQSYVVGSIVWYSFVLWFFAWPSTRAYYMSST